MKRLSCTALFWRSRWDCVERPAATAHTDDGAVWGAAGPAAGYFATCGRFETSFQSTIPGKW